MGIDAAAVSAFLLLDFAELFWQCGMKILGGWLD